MANIHKVAKSRTTEATEHARAHTGVRWFLSFACIFVGPIGRVLSGGKARSDVRYVSEGWLEGTRGIEPVPLAPGRSWRCWMISHNRGDYEDGGRRESERGLSVFRRAGASGCCDAH